MTKLKSLICALAAVCLLTSGGSAIAQQKTITIIVPAPAGGGGDISARSVIQDMEKSLGVTIVVENVAGATGNIGIKRALSAAPDGTTLLLVTGANTANAAARPQTSIDLLENFEPISRIGATSFILAASTQSGINSVADLIALAKKRPGELKYGSIGPGSNHHLLAEMLKKEAGINLIHVPYRGEAPAIVDLLAGRLDVMFLTSGMQYVSNNQLIALGITSGEPWPLAPNVKPLKLSGLKSFDYQSWNGLLAPKGTPKEIIQKINAAVNDALKGPRAKNALEAVGIGVGGGSPEVLAGLIARDKKLFGDIIRDQNLKFD